MGVKRRGVYFLSFNLIEDGELWYSTGTMSEEQPPSQPAPPQSPPPAAPQGQIPGADKKLICGILGISGLFWGGFGVHKFVLGYTKEGIIQLVLTLCCGIGAIIGVIEGIIYLTKSDEEFVNTYVKNKRPWF